MRSYREHEYRVARVGLPQVAPSPWLSIRPAACPHRTAGLVWLIKLGDTCIAKDQIYILHICSLQPGTRTSSGVGNAQVWWQVLLELHAQWPACTGSAAGGRGSQAQSVVQGGVGQARAVSELQALTQVPQDLPPEEEADSNLQLQRGTCKLLRDVAIKGH